MDAFQTINASSPPWNEEVPDVESTSNQQQAPENLLKAYRMEREEAEKSYFSSIIRIVAGFGVLTAIFQISGSIMLTYSSSVIQYTGVVVATLGELFATLTLLLVSTTCVTDPENEVTVILSVDDAARRNPLFSRALSISVGALCLILAIGAGYPYCRVSAAVPALLYGCWFQTAQSLWSDTTTTVAVSITVLLALGSGVQLMINKSPVHGDPLYDSTSSYFFVSGIVTVAFMVIVIVVWLRRRLGLRFAKQGDDPEGSIRCVYIIITSFIVIGIQCAATAPAFYQIQGQMFNFYYYFLSFVVYTLVPIAILLAGQKRMSSALHLFFQSTQAKKDGAIVAELLTRFTVPQNGAWYIKLAQPLPGDMDDHEKFWKIGHIVQRSEKEIVVQCKTDMEVDTGMGDYENVTIVIEEKAESSALLMEKAEASLRLIEWKDIDLKLLTGSIQGTGAVDITQLLKLSRPVRAGERIDYFFSHSWKDDPNAKLAALSKVVERFRSSNGRDPTFWLDKVCIDLTLD